MHVERGIGLGLHDFRCGYGADVADGIHVAQCHGRLAEVVDEIACRLHVAGVAGDYPAVVPDVAAFAGDGVVQFHTHGIGLLDGPDGVAAPGEVNPRLVLGHHFLAEVGFPAGDVGFHLLEALLGQGDGLRGVVVHQLLYGDGAVGQLPGVGVDDGGTVGIAVAVLHQYFAAVFGVPEDVPCAGLFGGNKLFVEEDTSGAPHVGHGIVLGLAFRLRGLVQLVANVGRHVGDVVRRVAEVAVDG